MFLVTFDSKEDVKKIYNIKHILHSIVKVEPVKLSNLIPQCKICQAFGHTKNYCGKEPRRVKCSGKHSTIDCKKLSDQKPKCCNCGQDHPANYRGCVVAKELQKIRDQKNFKPTIQNNRAESTGTTNGVTQSNEANTLKANKLSFAEVTKETIKSKKPNVKASNDEILAQILSKLNKQEEFNKNLQKRLSELEQQIKSQY